MCYFADRGRWVVDFVKCENGDRNKKKLRQDQAKTALKVKETESIKRG